MKVEEAQSPPGKQLVSTSQGNAFDRPPAQWIPDELRMFGVIGTPNIGAPDIQEPLHTLFSSSCWPQLHHNTRRFKAMLPSLTLATKLLKVSGPFIASFLPERKYDEDGKIKVSPVVDLEGIALAFLELEGIACQTKVREDESMWPNVGRQGIILPTGSGIKPDEPARDGIDAECWEKTTERDKDAGLRFRRLTIHLASQFGNTLESLVDENPDGGQYIQAAFMCAITLVHEVAHLINAANFEQCTWLGEPRVSGEPQMELGTSLIGWLFDGWIPENISLGRESRGDYSFKNGCCWYKQRREPRGYPEYHTLHSVPMAHIKRIFTEAAWSRFDENHTHFSIQVREELLRPQLPFRSGETARIAWKSKDHRTDISPALDRYYGIWDYHDPDWIGPQPGQDSGSNDAFSPYRISTRSVSTSAAEGEASINLGTSPSSKKPSMTVKANSPVVRSNKVNDGEQGPPFPSNKQQPVGMATLEPSHSSPRRSNHSVKRSPRPPPSPKRRRMQKVSAEHGGTRRSRRLSGHPAEHAEGLVLPPRKKCMKGRD